MQAVDTDRLLYFEDRDYKTEMRTLQPDTCSPKNNLLIGIPPT